MYTIYMEPRFKTSIKNWQSNRRCHKEKKQKEKQDIQEKFMNITFEFKVSQISISSKRKTKEDPDGETFFLVKSERYTFR